MVSNSGTLDGTELLYYNDHQVIEVRNGSERLERQIVHGTRGTQSRRAGIDEVVLEILDDGVVWVHQAEGDRGGSLKDWNVLALTDFAGRVVESYSYTPYGLMTVDQVSNFGDYDGDSLVTIDEVDANTNGVYDSGDTCYGASPSGDCRVMDVDGDVDAADATRLAELDSTTTCRQPGRTFSGLGNTRGHQGLIHDAETGSYNNRARQYSPQLKR